MQDQQPSKCPACHNGGGFTLKSDEIDYERRITNGGHRVEEVPRAIISTWRCNSCGKTIEVRRPLP